MKTSLKILGLAVVAALLMVVAVPAAEAPTAGTKAPDFTLKSQEGKTVSLHDFKGKWVRFETMRMDPKPIQKPHIPIIVGGYADAALRRAVRYGAGWYGFNRDIAATKDMLERSSLDRRSN